MVKLSERYLDLLFSKTPLCSKEEMRKYGEICKLEGGLEPSSLIKKEIKERLKQVEKENNLQL